MTATIVLVLLETVLPLLAISGCMEAHYSGTFDIDAGVDRRPAVDARVDVPPDAPMVTLSTTPGRYHGTCDGSAAVGLDADHFLGFSDTDQKLRVFARGADGGPIQTVDIGGSIGVGSGAKVDFEDVARVGNRLYAVSSHGRKNDGNIDPDRYRFIAVDVGGQSPSFTFAVAGSQSRLLQDMLATANWSTPDSGVLSALQNASKLDTQTATNLAPKSQGTNIEGLAWAPLEGQPDRLLLGLRNPRPNGKAIVVSLVNAPAMIGGAPARFGEAFKLDFGGLGIRGMTWEPAIHQVLIVAGPHDDSSGPFRLYRWPGTASTTPSYVMDLTPPFQTKPEGLVTYPNSYDIELVFDADDLQTGNTTCDNAPGDQRAFSDQVVHVE